MKNILNKVQYYFEKGFSNLYATSNNINRNNIKSNNLLKAPYKNNITILNATMISLSDCVGIGVNLQESDLAAIDIDGCISDDFIQEILRAFDLPIDYEWVVKSGSESGYHIIFRSTINERYKKVVSTSLAIAYFPYLEKRYFSKVEFLFEGQLVLPTSLHESGSYYTFLNKKPIATPLRVDIEKIIDFKKFYCSTQAESSYIGYDIDGSGLYTAIHYRVPIDKSSTDIFNKKLRYGGKILCNVTAKRILKFSQFENDYLIQVCYFLLDKNDNIVFRKIYNIIEEEFQNENLFENNFYNRDEFIDIIGEIDYDDVVLIEDRPQDAFNTLLVNFTQEDLEINMFKRNHFKYLEENFYKYTILQSFQAKHQYSSKIKYLFDANKFKEIQKNEITNCINILYHIYYKFIEKEIEEN